MLVGDPSVRARRGGRSVFNGKPLSWNKGCGGGGRRNASEGREDEDVWYENFRQLREVAGKNRTGRDEDSCPEKSRGFCWLVQLVALTGVEKPLKMSNAGTNLGGWTERWLIRSQGKGSARQSTPNEPSPIDPGKVSSWGGKISVAPRFLGVSRQGAMWRSKGLPVI